MNDFTVAFLSVFDSADIRTWSGTPFFMARSIENSSTSVQFIGPLDQPYRFRRALKRRAYSACGMRYHDDRDPTVLRTYARDAAQRLAKTHASVVLSPGAIPLTYLDTQVPLVMWADATFDRLVDYYPKFKNLAPRSRRDGYETERSALERITLAIFSSTWAASSAQERYRLPRDRVAVVPYGANLVGPTSLPEARRLIATRGHDECRLAFVAADWHRKGGEQALKVAARLNEEGVSARLSIVGCTPTTPRALPDWVELHGFIDKTAPAGRRALSNLLARSHFLILPTLADCTPIVVAEASAFGVPVLATRTGGLPEMVSLGSNGFLLEPGDVDGYCRIIKALFGDPRGYEELAASSFEEYRVRLNWTVSGEKVRALLRQASRDCH